MSVVMPGHKGQRGFSLTELIIAIAISTIIIMLSSEVFTIVLTQSGQQTKVVHAEMESIVGLRMLRYDLEHAGYGLPAEFPGGLVYAEAVSATASVYNDALTAPNPGQAPRAVLSGNGVGMNGSDYLVIKSSAVGTSDIAQMWAYMGQDGVASGPASAKFAAGNRVIVIKPKTDENSQNQLITGGAFFTQYSAVAALAPVEATYVIYGIDPDTDLRMPFNRGDYYISRPADISPSCAPNTGILYKASIRHSDGQANGAPIIDCVADMQVVFGRDTNGDGIVEDRVEDITALSAQQIREGIKEVRVYILAQEGKKDRNYRHVPQVIRVGEAGVGRDVDLAATIGTGWENYRWKLYTLVVRPKQLQ